MPRESVTAAYEAAAVKTAEQFSVLFKGKSADAYKAEQAEEERRSVDLYQRLMRLNELVSDFERLRAAHADLARDLREFGKALGLLHVETTDEVVKAESDGA